MTGFCPKRMLFGPCGGVTSTGGCEVDGHDCPFVDRPVPSAPGRTSIPLALSRPAIVVDVRAPRRWNGDARALWRSTAGVLAGSVALIGEHVDNPRLADDAGSLDPAEVIRILADAGVLVIATVTGRDRSIADAVEVICEYRDAGAAAIHCVTGDHPAAVGLTRAAVFSAEAMTLVGAAVDAGIPATVGESTASPGPRSQRLHVKQTAGASACILNHGGNAADLRRFAVDCSAEGTDLALIAPVPMITDKWSALGLAGFPGLRLPDGFLDRVIAAEDPVSEGLDAAATLAAEFARDGHFAGVNLSGSAGGADPYQRLEMTAEFIRRVRAEWMGA